MPSLAGDAEESDRASIEVPTAVLDRISGVRAGTRSMETLRPVRASRRHGVRDASHEAWTAKSARPRPKRSEGRSEPPHPIETLSPANPAHPRLRPLQASSFFRTPRCSYGLPADSRFDAVAYCQMPALSADYPLPRKESLLRGWSVDHPRTLYGRQDNLLFGSRTPGLFDGFEFDRPALGR